MLRPCVALVEWLERRFSALDTFLEVLEGCYESTKECDERSEGGWRPEVDYIWKAGAT